MSTYVVDTHSLVWYLAAPRQLGPNARHAFAEAAAKQATIIIPVIVFAEIIFAVERGRIQADVLSIVKQVKALPYFRVVPLSLATTLRLRTATAIPEMHDRMIVCEALRHRATLISKDETLRDAGLVEVVW